MSEEGVMIRGDRVALVREREKELKEKGRERDGKWK